MAICWWQRKSGPASRLITSGAPPAGGEEREEGEVEEEEEDTPGTLSDLLLSLQERETSLLNGRKLCEDKSIFSAPQIWFV